MELFGQCYFCRKKGDVCVGSAGLESNINLILSPKLRDISKVGIFQQNIKLFCTYTCVLKKMYFLMEHKSVRLEKMVH